MDILGKLDTGPSSGGKILAAFIPTFIVALGYFAVFIVVRNWFRVFYAPRTFLGTVDEKDRTPVSDLAKGSWFRDFKELTDVFILQHNSLDAYLYLRFLRFIIWICFLASCLTFLVLLPVNATGGGSAQELDRITFSNINKNGHIWAHVVVAWVLFIGILLLIAWERLQLIGIRQACYLREAHAKTLSARTVLFLNVPKEYLDPENLHEAFGRDAERSWPVKDPKDLEALVKQRNDQAFKLERSQFDLIVTEVKRRAGKLWRLNGRTDAAVEEQTPVPRHRRPTKRDPPIFGVKLDRIETEREKLREIVDQIEQCRSQHNDDLPDHSGVFVTFSTQQAAHIAFQEISFQHHIPLSDRFLAVQPKEVNWANVTRHAPERVYRALLALAFVIAFNIFFAIPVGILGSLSNAKELANRYEWLSWLNDLPAPILDLLTGLVPPAVTSWFTSYVPKLYRRYIAPLSGEVTVPQAELKSQAWYFTFQVLQVFLVTTFASGAASVVSKIAEDPSKAPDLLAANLPKASNFYLTYIILQGTTAAANNLLNYSDLLEYLFYEYIWDKTPREKFGTYAQMKGTPWGTWYPKFTNLFVIAIAYSCIAPLVTGFATIGIFFYYLSYRYGLLYVRQTKIDTKGEAYKRALQHMPTGTYFAELGLIGLFSARRAAGQAAAMIALLVVTAVANLLLDRMLRPLELYLGRDKWEQQEVPLLAEEDGVDPDDQAGLHAASHGRRLGLKHLPNPIPRWLSDLFDGFISSARKKTEAHLDDATTHGDTSIAEELSEEDIAKAYVNPIFTSKTPKLWIPRDKLGISKEEIKQNEATGFPTTDEGAEIDEHGKLIWDHRFENVPIYSKPKRY